MEEITEITYKDMKGNEDDLNQLIKVESDEEEEEEDFYETYRRTLS